MYVSGLPEDMLGIHSALKKVFRVAGMIKVFLAGFPSKLSSWSFWIVLVTLMGLLTQNSSNHKAIGVHVGALCLQM